MTIRRRAILGAAVSLPFAPAVLRAQPAFPSRTMRLVVPFAAGGSVDLTGRLIAERLQSVLGQTMVVDNRGGAGGNLGAAEAARSEKDGHTLLLASASILAANKFLYTKSMPIDPIKDLAPVTRVTTGTVFMTVNANSPYKTFDDVIKAARKDPGKLTMGSSGTGTISHLTIAKVCKATGVDITHVPYRGGAPALQDLLSGNIDMMFDVIPLAMSNVREGRLRVLAAASADRVTYSPELKDVPGMKELLPGSGIDMQSWYGMNVPAGVPQDRIAILHKAIAQVVDTDEFRAKMEPNGFTTVVDPSPEAYGAYLLEQEKLWKGLVEESGASLD
ncbi:Bug family tripartite tricarboxylate transporter substrate binding protein [Roseomonas marmotae]|uniref:Tripartite tricarboxylate transporter substrate binding protein n=1 Tax=Roseomonas marmotae TaxID=2768161 RepID=A0ABS3KDP6_9PROT|nr:tripartite tricarboxylate transporter substrate binding protein [Roseomonas marmotae]MBO1075589.1 tripartite tricarboxylate transporter substrate binding protein [Roseomonas marmotae]QTI79451.1 tripartite tricarboxylate transporter substrate binding protein [Roseomonas marmotae]